MVDDSFSVAVVVEIVCLEIFADSEVLIIDQPLSDKTCLTLTLELVP